jgi:glucoamylase
MYALMLRNIATDGFSFEDPLSPGSFSLPGCILASPSYPVDLATVNQDYVFNWTRDAAITAVELASASSPTVQSLIDYVTFAGVCQSNATPTLGHACFTIEGQSRPWTEQSDGPALQTSALLLAYPQLDRATQASAQTLIATNLAYLLGAYRQPTTNLWEEHSGESFFTRSAQLQCFQEIAANTLGIPVPNGIAAAITWLQSALAAHWNGTVYQSLLPAPGGYDPNIDIVLAAVYGAVPITDTKLLATAAALRSQWADSSSPSFYPINGADAGRGFGPMFGRYPGDVYDGDTQDPVPGGHPWALCTCAFAELQYELAAAIAATGAVPVDDLSSPFFAQIGVSAATAPADAQTALQAAADKMLQAVIFHSDHLELSEQFDGATGYEKSVANLTWSYAAFLSAVRARTGAVVLG